ncbi:hypothetical protein, partial [Nocardioides malaquae]|uniref:hypothetical protein n=1 Tax=Nocardioides malaquae TaxID=2773426 RepID=UPI001D0D6F20
MALSISSVMSRGYTCTSLQKQDIGFCDMGLIAHGKAYYSSYDEVEHYFTTKHSSVQLKPGDA